MDTSALKYVRDLKIASPPVGDFAEYTSSQLDSGDKAFVDAGSLVSFVSNISSQNRQDVLDSTLLAQLAADHAYDRQKDTQDWYHKYVEVLSKVGWVIQSFEFQKYDQTGATLEISAAIILVIESLVNKEELAALKIALTALQSPKNKNWLTLFSQQSSSAEGGSFQMLPCKEGANGEVVMGMGCFYFSGSTENDQWLWFKYSTSSISLFKAAQSSTLNKQVYGRVREAVREKLGRKANDFVKGLDID